jgi:hypothetical protein
MSDVFEPVDELRQHGSGIGDGGLVIAMTQAMGWDRPRVERVGGEVEGMSSAGVECACLCTGGGGGGGRH